MTVACNLPHGVTLNVHEFVDAHEPVLGGGMRDYKIAREVPGKRFEVFGNAVPFGGHPRTRIVAGFALTKGVPKDIWDAWLEQHRTLPMVKNGLIFAYGNTEDAADHAKGGGKILSGLEPINPGDDPRIPRSLNPNVSGVQPADDPRKAA